MCQVVTFLLVVIPVCCFPLALAVQALRPRAGKRLPGVYGVCVCDCFMTAASDRFCAGVCFLTRTGDGDDEGFPRNGNGRSGSIRKYAFETGSDSPAALPAALLVRSPLASPADDASPDIRSLHVSCSQLVWVLAM